jgi:nucleoside-diphosphate-sugar epimerase
LRTTIVRPFNIYGPSQVGEGAVHQFVVRAIRGEPLTIHGDGDQIRSWCYIDDLVNAIMLILATEKSVGEVFNIGNPRGTITVLSLAEKIVDLAGSNSRIEHVPRTHTDVELRIPNIDKAMAVLGFHPKIDLNEGLRRTIEWYRKSIIP